ncbi:MAG: iron complex outermembrane receptor protein, partial [Gammaproteobacteria bacterium]
MNISSFLFSFLVLTNAVFAQQTDSNTQAEPELIEEVIVSGQYVQRLDLDSENSTGSRLGLTSFETPATIDVIDSVTMTMRGFKSVTEAAESLPGVLSGEAPGEPSSFSMRGFQQNQITELRDGLRAGPHNMTMRPQNTFNLERVEILKGPSSVLYGEGAVAGTINMVTKKPVLGEKTKSELLLSYGRYNNWEIGLGSGGSLSDQVAYRLDIDNAQSDGWVDKADSRSTNVTGAILWAITDNFDLMLTGDYLDDDLPSYWGTPFVSSSFAGENAMRHVISSTDDRTIDRRTRFLNYNVSDHVSKSNHFWGRLLAEWRVSEDLTLRNQFYYFNADRQWINSEQYLFNTQTDLIDRDRFFVLHDQELFGDRFDITVNHLLGKLENTVVVGVDYSSLDFVRSRGFPDGDSVDPLNPLSAFFGPLDKRRSPTKMDTIAVFFEDRLRINDELSLIGGLRYDHIDLARENFNLDGSFDSASSFTDSYKPLSWRLGAVYQFTPAMSVYGQYSKAQDPPSSSSLFLVNAGQNFNLSEADQWEVGLKAQFENANSAKMTEVTLSIYDINRDNILTQISQTEVSNIGKQSSMGAELAIATDATERWRIGGNASYIDSKYDLFFDPDFGIDATGMRPANVPKWALNVWTSIN